LSDRDIERERAFLNIDGPIVLRQEAGFRPVVVLRRASDEQELARFVAPARAMRGCLAFVLAIVTLLAVLALGFFSAVLASQLDGRPPGRTIVDHPLVFVPGLILMMGSAVIASLRLSAMLPMSRDRLLSGCMSPTYRAGHSTRATCWHWVWSSAFADVWWISAG
jgi:hypothetical protein